MGLRRFFSPSEIINDQVNIDGEEYHHVANVMRCRPGDELEIINGRGRLLHGRISALKNHCLQVKVLRFEKFPMPKPRIIIAPSLTRGHAMNWLIEKLTEMGVDEIRPLLCERTDVSYNAAQLRRWEKIAAQSLKVNRKYWLTRIFPPVSPAEIVVQAEKTPGKVLLDIDAEKKTGQVFPFPVLAVIGPPGDFSENEKKMFRGNDFVPILINDCILKTETAALAIAAIYKNA
jgi:16S rRNA (uracil1498-N3)-methyltransferase